LEWWAICLRKYNKFLGWNNAMMTEMVKIIGVGFITALVSIILRGTKPELSFAVTITGVIVILLFIIDALRDTLGILVVIAQTTGVDNGLLKILIKIVGVGYLTEFCVGILTDFGSNSVADKVMLAGKLTILLMSLPVIKSLLLLIQGFLQFI
jgi:stage III sporulation protein AD